MTAICSRFCCPGGRGRGRGGVGGGRVINGSCGNYGLWVLFDLGLTLSRLWGSLWAIQSREIGARASPSVVILLGRFSDTLLLVSILDIVYDCHL